MVDTEGYIWHLILPIVLKVNPVMLRQAISDPAARPVPRSGANVLAKLISMEEVMELLAEF